MPPANSAMGQFVSPAGGRRYEGKKRLSEEQISGLLKEAEAGAKGTEGWRRQGISEATSYTGRQQDGGRAVSEGKRV